MSMEQRDNGSSVSADLAADGEVVPVEDADLVVAEYNSEEETVEEIKRWVWHVWEG